MNKRIPIFFGLILVCLSIWMLMTTNKFVSGFIERLDTLGYDLQLRTRINTIQSPSLSPIVIVDIDEKSLKAEGRWPWPRGKLAKLIDHLHASGASVIAFDMIFPEKERNIVQVVTDELNKRDLINSQTTAQLIKNKMLFDEDALLAKSIVAVQPIVALGFLSSKQKNNTLPNPILTLTDMQIKELNISNALGYVSNIPIIQNAAKQSGFINVYPDIDGIIRRVPLIIQYGKGVYPSLALSAVMNYLGQDISLFSPQYNNQSKLEGILIGTHFIPTDETGKALIPFVGRSFTFSYFSATDVLDSDIASEVFKDKIIFIGTSALGLGDLQPTAIQNPYPGVEIHASVANGILKDNFSSVPEWTRGAELFLTILFGLLTALIFPYLGPRILGIAMLIIPSCLLFLNHWIWHKTGLVFSLVIPVFFVLLIGLVNIIYGYLFETRRREQIKEIFGQYVPAKHIDEMLKSTGGFALKGESRELTVLFADIRNFTMISENMPANELVDMLNIFFTPMTEIIFKHRGTIDKYVGDLIMAFWGAPLKDKKHAEHAVLSALEMQAKIRKLREVTQKHHWADLNMGIGINSGMMSVGDMGSHYRRNYTVLGDAVNLASRIESLAKFYGVNIIATEYTINNQTKFVVRKLDKVRVKGKQNGVAIFEVICLQSEIKPELIQELSIYHQALEFYYQQNWNESLSIMMELQNKFPNAKIYKIYIERIKEFKLHALPENWDGIYVHESK